MSGILKGDILNSGNLEKEIYDAINFFGCKEGYTGPTDPCKAQEEFAQRLADAISEGVARGVQKYLQDSVKTINKPTLQNSGGTIPSHIHPNVPLYSLQAP
jgi:hypothetical protein